MNLWHSILFIIFLNAFEIESGKIRTNFDEIFGDGWDKNEREEKLMIKIEQNERNEQNDNSTAAVDQIGEETGIGRIVQMKNDQKNVKINQNIKDKATDQQKREIVNKFEVIKEKLKEKGKFEWKNQGKIEWKIAKLLGTNRKLIQKWKNELNLNQNKIKKQFYEQKKRKFIERFDEFKELYGQGKQNEFVKELGIHNETFRKWKKELLPNCLKTTYTNDDKLKKMKQYFEIKEANPKVSDKIIAKKLGIGFSTLNKWKKECSSST